MPIIQPKIIVPDNIYKEWLKGSVEIKGLAKDTATSRIVKHLDVVGDSASNENALRGAIAAGIFAAGIAACTCITVTYFRALNDKKVEEFKKALISYADAVQCQTLTINHIDKLIESLDRIKHVARRKLMIDFSIEDLTKLVDCLCYHTKTLAEANGFNYEESYTPEEKYDILLRLRKNLQSQKQLFNKTA